MKKKHLDQAIGNKFKKDSVYSFNMFKVADVKVIIMHRSSRLLDKSYMYVMIA